MRTILLAAFVFSLLMPVGARAEPDATFRRLMDEPASLFDVGMDRLERWMDQFMLPQIRSQLEARGMGSTGIQLSAYFDWDANDLVIVASSEPYPIRDWTKAECRLVMDDVNNSFLSPEVIAGVFDEIFSHRNSQRGRRSMDTGKNMAKRLIVKTSFFSGVNCEQRVGGRILYTE